MDSLVSVAALGSANLLLVVDRERPLMIQIVTPEDHDPGSLVVRVNGVERVRGRLGVVRKLRHNAVVGERLEVLAEILHSDGSSAQTSYVEISIQDLH